MVVEGKGRMGNGERCAVLYIPTRTVSECLFSLWKCAQEVASDIIASWYFAFGWLLRRRTARHRRKVPKIRIIRSKSKRRHQTDVKNSGYAF